MFGSMKMQTGKVTRRSSPVRAALVAGFLAGLFSTGALAGSGDEDIEASWSAASDRGVYKVSIRPADGDIPIGKLHSWIIRVALPDGTAVFPARVFVGGGMQGHGHGLPTQPQVIRYGGEGEYLVEGVRFSMEGEWQLSFIIESSHGRDRADFEVPVRY